MRKLFFGIALTLALTRCSGPGGKLLYIEPGPENSFNFPYFLFIPDKIVQGETVFILIEPNNSGFVDDDLEKHKEKAERIATRDFYIGNYVSRTLQVPLLVPVFPRPETDWKIYTHALDRDVMIQKANSLERIDEQLIGMFNDARARLEKKDIVTGDKFLLTGFSASGTFANRFTLMHPEKVMAVAAGGVNGLLMLPVDSLNGEQLIYPVGTGDLRELLDIEFQRELFLRTPQFYFMGELDDNDAVPYSDAYDHDEREQIYRIAGSEMQPGRWEFCRKIYMDEHVDAIIKTYAQKGHEHPEIIKKEIMEFMGSIIERSR